MCVGTLAPCADMTPLADMRATGGAIAAIAPPSTQTYRHGQRTEPLLGKVSPPWPRPGQPSRLGPMAWPRARLAPPGSAIPPRTVIPSRRAVIGSRMAPRCPLPDPARPDRLHLWLEFYEVAWPVLFCYRGGRAGARGGSVSFPEGGWSVGRSCRRCPMGRCSADPPLLHAHTGRRREPRGPRADADAESARMRQVLCVWWRRSKIWAGTRHAGTAREEPRSRAAGPPGDKGGSDLHSARKRRRIWRVKGWEVRPCCTRPRRSSGPQPGHAACSSRQQQRVAWRGG